MNSRNRHMQYRKSIYRKRRIRAILISSAVVIIVAFALFMVMGTALHNKTQQPSSTDGQQTSLGGQTEKLPSAAAVGAYALPLLEDGSAFASRLNAVATDANAVCINLNRPDGTLLYRTQLSDGISDIRVASDASPLSNAISSIERSGYHISAVLYIPSFDIENDLVADVDLAIWASICCEALREGVEDILLIAPSMDSESIEKIYSLANSIHSTVEDSIIGFAVQEPVLLDQRSASLLDNLARHFNFLALDTTSYREDEDPLTFIEGKISSLQLELMYYKMRILLPKATAPEIQQQYIESVTKYNISSWQILP